MISKASNGAVFVDRILVDEEEVLLPFFLENNTLLSQHCIA